MNHKHWLNYQNRMISFKNPSSSKGRSESSNQKVNLLNSWAKKQFTWQISSKNNFQPKTELTSILPSAKSSINKNPSPTLGSGSSKRHQKSNLCLKIKPFTKVFNPAKDSIASHLKYLKWPTSSQKNYLKCLSKHSILKTKTKIHMNS